MQILSDYRKDHVTPDKKPGAYEWWYFDAIDPESGYAFVVIFYQGNPFSNRYIRAMEQEGEEPAKPENFPAVSISIYKGDEVVYYSFSEYDSVRARFDQDRPKLQIGNHFLDLEQEGEQLLYRLELNETLVCGDRIEAKLEFSSPKEGLSFHNGINPGQSAGHAWNLVQPRAKVRGEILIFEDGIPGHEIDFQGTGYHDHNTGQEPMKDEFRDWYWGRFHFPDHTLIYYVMNRKEEAQHRAWLLDNNSTIVSEYQEASLSDRNLTLFGLNPAHKIVLQHEQSRILVQQSRLLDNGPFYRRYLSDAFLNLDGGTVQKSRGISEYIYPGRIYWKLYWPFVDMRIRYQNEPPHWVQKSRTLYRWTW